MEKFNLKEIFNLEGRENLGHQMPIGVYRLFEHALREYLTETYGKDFAISVLKGAGYRAGVMIVEQMMDITQPFPVFIKELQKILVDQKMGILRIERHNKDTGDLTLTLSEDLDCSGLPMIGETVCNYDEGLLAGILSTYTKHHYTATEIDCWAKGDRVCRFEASIKK